jgi:hypothetical protein
VTGQSDTATRGEVGELPDVTSYDPGPDREKVRGRLAGGVLGLLAGTIAVSFLGLWQHWGTPGEMKDFLGVLLSPLFALAGSALGFYFGSKNA